MTYSSLVRNSQLLSTLKTRVSPDFRLRRLASRWSGVLDTTLLRLQKWRFGRGYAGEVFTRIYRENGWDGSESVSGPGSSLEQTAKLRAELPEMLSRLDIRTLTDVPCGDWLWMSHTALPRTLEHYIGGDIVTPLVEDLQSRYGTGERHFRRIDLLTDRVPTADAVLCRDCLVHFSFADIVAAIRNIKASGARYLLTTTFVRLERNTDIVTGQWRPLNLSRPPFQFGPPVALIQEDCTEGGGRYGDKSLAAFCVRDLPDIVL